MWSSRRPGVATSTSTPCLELGRLRLHVDAAVDHRDAQLRMLGVRLDVGRHLVGELARRRDHQRAHRVARRRHAGVLVAQHLVQQRQRERRRLAGARLRRAHHVSPGEHDRDRLRLDRRHQRVALVGHRLLELGRQAQRRKLHRAARGQVIDFQGLVGNGRFGKRSFCHPRIIARG